MDQDCDVSEEFDCPSLLCEEQEDLETRNSQSVERKRKEEDDGAEMCNQINGAEEVGGNEQKKKSERNVKEKDDAVESVAKPDEEVRPEEPQEGQGPDRRIINNESVNVNMEDNKAKSLENRNEHKRGRKRRCKRQCDRGRIKRRYKGVCNNVETKKTGQTREAAATMGPSAISESTAGLIDSRELSDPIYLGCGPSGLYCPSVPIPLLYSSQPPVPIQPAPPQSQGTKSLHSPYLPHNVPQTNSQPLEMEITQIYSTRRSIRYSTRGRARTLGFPMMPGLENIDNCLLPPPPKKKARTLYSTDQLEHLESLFEEDHYPDAEKRKAIAASIGVTPQRIMVWFQNRRAKWRKVERSGTANIEQRPNKAGPHCSPPGHIKPALPNFAPNKAPSFSGNVASNLSQIAPAAPACPTSLYSNLPVSPGQSRGRDGDQHQLSSHGGLAEYHPRPMHSPPPIRRVSLPLYTATYNPANSNPPLLNTLAHTPPLFLDALEVGSSLAHHDTQSLQADTSSLFDFGEKFDYLTSTQQNNLLYQLQTSYPSSQPQHQPQASLPHMSYLTPSPYLTPNPPVSNPTSYLTFGPGGGSTGVVTYSSGGHTFFQSQSTGQVLLQSTGHHGGITAYQSYPWGNMYNQPTMHQRPQCPPTYPSSLGAPRDHQLAPSTSLPPSLVFTRGDHGPANPQRLSHTQTHTTTSSTTVLPPVSTLRPSRLRAETTLTKAASYLPSQISPTSPEGPPVPPCVKIEYDSPQEVHSHFHCDFSPIHF